MTNLCLRSKFRLSSIAVAVATVLVTPALANTMDPPAPAAISINGEVLPYNIWHATVLPGEEVNFETFTDDAILLDGSRIPHNWRAPDEAGVHKVEIRSLRGILRASVTLFVLEPSTSISKRGFIGDYRIGFYPKDTPEGFIRLDKGDANLRISPHFKVGQFLCKQQPGTWPKYLIVSDENLIRLETLLQDLNKERDTDADTLFVMSGFRTPFYNAAIGSAKYSRHMHGDAADVYVDSKPRDGNMDDLNQDGRITKADANFLYDYAVKLYKDGNLRKGGLGSYKANAVHGPFVHIDARGRPARWGR